MKTIGLLGGTGWSSTIGYYKTLNEMMHQRLGGFHSAKILLKSIDYHDIMMNYGKNHDVVSNILKNELSELLSLKPDCIIICCNSLHKYYDLIKDELDSTIPILHAVELVALYIKQKNYHKVLLLATKFTMGDGFFEKILVKHGIDVTIPSHQEREEIHLIHAQLMENQITASSKKYFQHLIRKYGDLDAVVLGCTEFPLVINQENSHLPLIDPVYLQAEAAVCFSLDGYNLIENDKRYIVYVKHYLTDDGFRFFINKWFPQVYEIMRQQKGFISLIHQSDQDNDDCVNVIVKFENQSTLESWGYSAEHDALVNALDEYRSKNYWEYAIVDSNHDEMNWQRVPSALSI